MALPDMQVSRLGTAQRLRNWSLAAAVFFLSFYPFLALYTPQPELLQRVPPAFASIYLRLSDIPLILTLVIHLVIERRRFFSAPASLRMVTIPALLLVVLALVSMTQARLPILALMAAIRLLAAAGLALIVGKSDRRWVVWPLVASAVASAILGAAQYRPEHFRHANGAEALIGVWIAGDGLAAERALLAGLGVPLGNEQIHAPEPVQGVVARLPRGEVALLPGSRQLVPGRPIVGATLRVRDLKLVQRALAKGTWKLLPVVQTKHGSSVFLPPGIAHGIWLEFRQER